MKVRLSHGLTILFVILLSFSSVGGPLVQAQTQDNWWNEEWPYRIAIRVSEAGPTAINIDFSQLFSDLGLVGAILDLQSIRVIPMISGAPGDPIPYQETYSTPFLDDETLNMDDSTGDPFWDPEYQIELTLDELKSTEGSYAIKSVLDVIGIFNYQVGFTYNFNGAPFSDWSQYESLTYNLWPEVNPSALDQSPDLFHFQLLGMKDCIQSSINSPALALDQWNKATVSLVPYGECPAPDLSALTGFRLFFNMALNSDQNDYEPGDQVTLWLDNFRLVDQDGDGEIRWNAEPGIDTYFIYFDTLNHTGHDSPILGEVPDAGSTASIIGTAEAGGYFHQVSGAETAGLSLWTAPTTEKILKGQAAPVTQDTLEITAAKGEAEALQLIVQSAETLNLPVSVSDLTHESDIIPASAIRIFRVDYVTLTRLSDQYGRLTEWPDPLYPISPGQEVVFPANENQPLWFRVEVPPDAAAGEYTGEISIGEATIPFTLTVWDFTLPTHHILPFAAGLDLEVLLEAYGGTVLGDPQPCYENLIDAINATLDTYHITALPPETEPGPGRVYTLTNYAQEEAYNAQLATGETIWWSFTSQDRPPFANPAILDRPGQDARILPWMAWADNVNGLYTHQLTDWDESPWESPFANYSANGDGYLFYPPNDETVGFDPCNPESNRLIPSIRLELLREGLEDYAYLRLLGSESGDPLADQILSSRTLYHHAPTVLLNIRAEAAIQIVAKIINHFIPLFTY